MRIPRTRTGTGTGTGTGTRATRPEASDGAEVEGEDGASPSEPEPEPEPEPEEPPEPKRDVWRVPVFIKAAPPLTEDEQTFDPNDDDEGSVTRPWQHGRTSVTLR